MPAVLIYGEIENEIGAKEAKQVTNLIVHDRGGGGLLGFPIVRVLKRHIYLDGQQLG